MIKNILDVAGDDESVRAVIRTDLFPKRKYGYYNFYFVVNDTEKYDSDIFVNCFSERILLYRGDKNYPQMFPNNTKAHLMVFRDGTTIAITIMDKDTFMARYNGEQDHENVWIGDTYKKILDKDGILSEIERLDETQTLFAQKPSEEEFTGVCNEFWWVLKTFAEYTLRKELPSAMFYLNMSVRDLLHRMIKWYIYLKAGQAVDMGILDGNMEKLLDEDMFSLYKQTYPAAEYDQMWEAFDAVAQLWHLTGKEVAGLCGYVYPEDTETEMMRLISALRDEDKYELVMNAKTISELNI